MRTAICLGIICILSAAAHAAVIGKATVTADQAPVMSGKQVIATAKKGDTFDVSEEKGDWYGVLPTRGWIQRANVKYEPAASVPPAAARAGEKKESSAVATDSPAPASPPLAPASQSSSDGQRRKALIAALVKKGDRIAATSTDMFDKYGAMAAYTFAAMYAPEDAAVRDKMRGLELGFVTSDKGMAAMRGVAPRVHSADPFNKPWPAAAPGIDLVELAILLDDRLVGNLTVLSVSSAGGAGEMDVTTRDPEKALLSGRRCVFAHQPTLSAAQAISTYGKPTAEDKHPDGYTSLTYGRFRLVANRGGQITAVLIAVATTIKSESKAAIQAQLAGPASQQQVEKRIAALKANLEADPKDAASRKEIVRLYLVEMDNPVEAAKFVDETCDEATRKYVPAAAKPVESAPEAACTQLGDWYKGLADQATTPASKDAMLRHAQAYYQRFLVLHPQPRTSVARPPR